MLEESLEVHVDEQTCTEHGACAGGIMAVLRKLMQFLPQRVSRLMPGTTKHARMTSDNVSHLPVFAATPSEQ